MRVVLQRVKHARVLVEDKITGQIGTGILALVGFEESDTQEDFDWIINKMMQMRIFPDENGVMNISIQDVEGEFLIVSQFTLHASTKKGNRPSYIKSSPPQIAKAQYDQFLFSLQKNYIQPLQTGEFGADMQVDLCNDGPVTICLDSKNKE